MTIGSLALFLHRSVSQHFHSIVQHYRTAGVGRSISPIPPYLTILRVSPSLYRTDYSKMLLSRTFSVPENSHNKMQMQIQFRIDYFDLVIIRNAITIA